MQEIVLSGSVKPALEWVNNRVLQKVSPERKHSLAQGRFFSALDAWASALGCGTVGPEWRFQVRPVGGIRRSLVPDVAYISYRRIPFDELEATDAPAIAPDVVVEVISPHDRKSDIEEKTQVYLSAGTTVVFLVNARDKCVTVIDVAGRRSVEENGIVEHEALPGFKMAAQTLFEMARPSDGRGGRP